MFLQNHVFKVLKEESQILYLSVLFNTMLAIVCLIGLGIDDRQLMGINIWIKPLKFALSTGIYIGTIGFLMSVYPYGKKKKSIISNVIGWSLCIEMLIIVGQALRGVQSHYNMSSALDGILFALMGILIGINVIIMFLFLIDSIRLKLKTSKLIQLAIIFGWLLVIFGSWVGGQMISQMSHTVGLADGGEGLPLLNWSKIGGDLRIAHFFGLHSIQIIPLFAWIVSKKLKMKNHYQFLTLIGFALLYAMWMGFTFWQAKQGISLISL